MLNEKNDKMWVKDELIWRFLCVFTVCWAKTKEFKSVDYNRSPKRSKKYHKPNKNYSNISWDAWSEAIDLLIWSNRSMLTAALTWITFKHFCFFTLFQLIYFGPQKEKMSLLQLFRDKGNCKKSKTAHVEKRSGVGTEEERDWLSLSV